MTRRHLLLSALAQRPPNIVLMVADDLGYGELGCQGNPEIPTPNIDSIARRGVRFTQGYVTAPFCSPSRAGLLTGRYQTRFGHELNVTGKLNLDPKVGLPLSQTTLADRLHASGYRTGCFGKWHLGATAPLHPLKRGFDEFFGFLHEGHFYVPPPYDGVVSHLRANEPPYDADNPILRGREPVEEKLHLTEALTREATAFVDRNRSRPFFLYLPYNAVHSPMQAAMKYLNRFGGIESEHRRVFAAMLSAMDDSVGAVLERLRRHNLERDTLVFFVSDNGGPTAELTSSNHPLRGFKGQLWEGGIRVPFLARWPGRIPEGKTFDHPVISLDILSTALGRDSGDGVNLLPYLANGSRPHETLFWRHGRFWALRQGDLKLVYQAGRPTVAAAVQLYDLAHDPSETRDLAAGQPETVRRLQAEWDRINREMVPPLWGPRA